MPAAHDRLVIYDIDFPEFLENRALDVELMRAYPGASAIASLAVRMRELGVEMVTPDVYLRENLSAAKTVVCTNDVTRFTDELINRRGLRGALVLSGESPIVAWRFYAGLPETSKWYRDAMLFPGARELVDPSTRFHDFHWPHDDFTPQPGLPWEERELLTMVSGNKRAFGWPRPAFDLLHPKRSAGRWYRAWQAHQARDRYTWLQSELYLERLEAVAYFGDRDGFDLYGRGWDRPTPGADAETSGAIQAAYRGELPPLDKAATLGRYRFSLCFENTAFPGYITEKVFDCLVAGNIPIYLGAPDIERYVPRDCFVDFRSFGSYPALETFMRSMTAEEAAVYQEAGSEFLASPEAQKYTIPAFVDCASALLLEALEEA